MKKLIAVFVVVGSLYATLLRMIADFITRDVDDFMKKIQITEEESHASLQVRKEYLHRLEITALMDKICETSPLEDECMDEEEWAYMRREVAKIAHNMSPKREF